MKNIYFVRHGRTEWNAIRRMQGQWNSNLDDLGRQQADVSGRLLAGCNIEAMFASPLDRTRQTAALINRYLQLPIVFDDRLKEWDCGDWSGYLYADIETRWPEEWRRWRADPFYYRAPNAENYPDMIARATPFLDELHTHAAQNIAIVSHGMIGKAMISTLLGFDEKTSLSFHQPNDRVFRVTLNTGGASVAHYNGIDGPFAGVETHDEGAATNRAQESAPTDLRTPHAF